MQRFLVRNVGLRKPSKCHLILESFYISAPVAAQSFIPRQEFAVSIVHILINTVRPNRGNMLKLHKHNPRTSHEQEMVKREIESTDERIDRLVYELYGLSEEEIAIVEQR